MYFENTIFMLNHDTFIPIHKTTFALTALAWHYGSLLNKKEPILMNRLKKNQGIKNVP